MRQTGLTLPKCAYHLEVVVDLVAIEQLRQLKYRYLRTLDLKQWDDFADTLTDDVSASYGERLSFEGREAVVLRDINNLSYREIADVAGIPLGTVMSRLARARSMLRAAWNGEEGSTT